MKSEQILNYLLENKANRVQGIDLYGKPFQIGVYRSKYGFLVATAYKGGKAIPEYKGLILQKHTILSWLTDSQAQIMEAKT